MLAGNNRLIGDNVVEELGAERPRESEIIDLNGCWPPREYAGAAISGISVQIDQNIDFRLPDEIGDFLIAFRSDVDDPIERCPDPAANVGVIACPNTNRGHLKTRFVVMFEEAHRQI